jgi:hypothetical protein
MSRRLFLLGLLGCALATPLVQAQSTTVASAPAAAASAVDAASIQALKDMGAHLQSLRRFGVSVDLSGERVLDDGQKLQHSATADLDVARPNRLFARMSSARSTRELFFDGKSVTLFQPAQNYFARTDFSGTVGEMVRGLQQRYGVEVPLSDLFLWGTPEAPLDKIDSAMNAGQDIIGDDLCDHYAFRQGNFDWQIWITSGAKPLPRKLVITDRSDEARPQSVSLISWNLNPTFKDAVFRFTPPKASKQIELVPVKTK